MDNFNTFPLAKSLHKSLEKMKMAKPTDVQVQAIPFALDGKDVIVSAPTGTGKTLAFSIPVANYVLSNQDASAVIITPTRELAMQITTVVQSLLFFSREIKTALLIGGNPMGPQLSQLKARPRIIIGTPGRINDHLKRKSLNLDQAKFLVLDEMDRMLDMGFSIQIDEVLKYMSAQRQSMMLSATISKGVRKLSERYLTEPEQVTIAAAEIVNTDIKQEFLHIGKEEKYDELVKQLSGREGTIIIFVKTKRNAEDIANKLYRDRFKAKAIHGDLRQRQRERIVKMLRSNELQIVVATDVASRGLDVPHIRHVINYNLPTNPEDYVHRVGRTGRAGQEGDAITFISDNERKEWRALEVFLDPSKKPQKQERQNNGRGRAKKGFGSNSRRKPGGERSRSGDAFGGGNGRGSRSGFGSDKPRGERSRSGDADSRGNRGERSVFGSDKPREERSRSGGAFGKGNGRSVFGSDKPRGERSRSGDADSRGNRGERSSFGSDKPRGERSRNGAAPARGNRSEARNNKPRTGGADAPRRRKI